MGAEYWAVFPDFPRYEVSTHGRVRRASNGYLMKMPRDKDGYSRLMLSPGRKQIRVCRAVAVTFLPNPEGKPFVNHIDGVRDNDSVSNLEWATASENARHAFAIGNHSGEIMGRAQAVLTDDQVREIRSPTLERGGVTRLAKQFGIGAKHASRVRNGGDGVYKWVKL